MSIISFLFFFSIFRVSEMADNIIQNTNLVKVSRSSSSREELVQMAGYGEEKLSTVLITGTLVCDYHSSVPTPTPVSGAKVGVSCQTSEDVSKLSWAKCTTDEYGDFLIDLPSHLHAIPNLEQNCLIKVLKLPQDYYSLCHPTVSGQPIGLKLSSVGDGIRTYTAQTLHLKPISSKM